MDIIMYRHNDEDIDHRSLPFWWVYSYKNCFSMIALVKCEQGMVPFVCGCLMVTRDGESIYWWLDGRSMVVTIFTDHLMVLGDRDNICFSSFF
jgi:hypothetical protein